MTKRKKIYLTAAIAVLLSLCAVFAAAALIRSEKTNAAELSVEKELLSEYEEGEWIDIPSGTLTIDGKSYEATAVLYYPDGSATRESGGYLTLSGKYVVVYTATVNGRQYSEKTEFTVNAEAERANARITVDFAGYTEQTLPNAVKGAAYKVFAAKAYVKGTNVPVTAEVCYLYGERSRFLTQITDGAFVPERAGVYEITYTAKNLYGEETTKTVSVTAIDSAAPLTITATNRAATAGKTTNIPVPAIGKDDRLGKAELSLTLKKGDYEELVYEGRADNAKIEYLFERTGEWELLYKLSDYSRTTEASAVMNVEAPAAAFENSSATTEPAFIAGKSYKLPETRVVVYDENGKRYEDAEVVCVLGSGETAEIKNGVLTLPETDTKIVTLRWTYQTLSKSVTVPVRSIKNSEGTLTPENLFLLGKGTAQRTEDGTSIDISRAKTAKIINKLSGTSLNISLYASSFAENGSFAVSFTDSLNASQKITLEIVWTTRGVTARIKENGYEKKIDVTEETLGKEIRISYSALGEAYNAFKVNEKFLDLPSDFKGFASGAVFAEMTSAATSGKILVTRVCGQRTGDVTRDAVAPSLVLTGAYSSLYVAGETIKTVKAFGLDVLDGYSFAELTVTNAESGNYVRTTDGKEINGLNADEEYEIKLEKTGRYRIQYITKDLSGNRNAEVMYVTAYGNTAPEITLGEITQKVAKVGDKLELPEITVKSGGEETEKFFIVYAPNGKGEYLKENAAYTFTAAGSYKIEIFATDGEGNTASEYYFVEVIA